MVLDLARFSTEHIDVFKDEGCLFESNEAVDVRDAIIPVEDPIATESSARDICVEVQDHK